MSVLKILIAPIFLSLVGGAAVAESYIYRQYVDPSARYMTSVGGPDVSVETPPDSAMDPCDEDPVLGDTCADGSVYAGLNSDGIPFFVAATNEPGQPGQPGGQYQWKTSQTSTPGANSRSDGRANTNAIILAGLAAHPAAAACVAKGPEWYLPSPEELETIYSERFSLAAAGLPLSAPMRLWSSSERDPDDAKIINLYNGEDSLVLKDALRSVRCVKR